MHRGNGNYINWLSTRLRMWLQYVLDLDDCPLRGDAVQNLQEINVSCPEKQIKKKLNNLKYSILM